MSERAAACPGPNQLAAFLDGRLTAEDEAAVQTHIGDCDACLALVAETAMAALPDLVARPVGNPTSVAPRAWSRSPRAAGLAAVAAVLVAALLVSGLWSLPRRQGPMLADLADAAGQGRPVEGRLTGGFTHRPWFAPLAGGQGGAMTSSTAIQLAAGKIRGTLDAGSTAPRLHDYGVSQVLLRDWDQAARALTAAAREQPRNARYQSDLAALYLERVRNGQHPGDLIKALAAAERARLADPQLAEAWFNRALALEQLALRPQAQAAWTEYLAIDASSPWAQEARDHLALLEVPAEASRWPHIEARLRSGVDAGLAREAVQVQATESRVFLESVMWPAWAATVLARRPADREREDLRTMGDAFLIVSADSLYRDAVTAIDRAEQKGPAALRALAAAHARYADAAALARQDLYTAALPKLSESREELAGINTPFAARADLDLAGALYYTRNLAETSATASRLLKRAQTSGYRSLESRAVWLLGLVAFGEGRYGDARDHWERMLTTAQQGADIEQTAAAHGLLANLLDHLGDSGPAWQHRRVALAEMERSGATRLRYPLLFSAAGQALKEHDPAAALALQNAVVETARQSGRPVGIAESLAARASIHAALKLADRAAADLATARSEVVAIPDAALRARIEGMVLLADVNVLRASRSPALTQTATRAIRWFEDANEPSRLPVLYLALGEALVRRGDFTRAGRAAADGIAIFERELIARPAIVGSRSDEGWQLYEIGLRAALAEGDIPKAFRYGDRARSRGLRPNAVTGAELTSLQETLSSDEAILALNQLQDELVTWVVTRHDVRSSIRRVSQQDAERLVLRQADEISLSSGEPPAASALFREIVRPLLPALQQTSRVTVAPDAPYFAASFSGLWNVERRRFWVEDVEIVVSSRMDAVDEAAAPGSARTVVDVASLATADETVGAWTSAPAGSVIELGARAVSNNHLPHLSRIVLADVPGRPYSGTWLAKDVSRLPRVRAVLLPNVDAGERPVFGAGTYDVASAFLEAGTTAHVVSTITSAPVDATLAARLRQRLQSETSVVSAVASVQRDAIDAAGQRLGSWSRVVVYGSGH